MISLEIVRGTTTPFTFTISQSGAAVNLTGKQLVFTAGTTTQTVKKTGVGGSGFVVTDAANGIASLTFTVAETRAMTPPRFNFSMELWESAGATQTLVVEGEISVRDVVNVDA